MTDWTQPQQVSDVFLAFPARVVGTYLPLPEEIPQEFWDESTDEARGFARLAQRLSTGDVPSDMTIEVRTDLNHDPGRHIMAVLGSFEPKHEHKIAGAAYLMSLWFSDLRMVEEGEADGNRS